MYWFKIIFSTIPTLGHHDLLVKVTDIKFKLKFYAKVFKVLVFLNHLLNLSYMWSDDRYWFKFYSALFSLLGMTYRSRSKI